MKTTEHWTTLKLFDESDEPIRDLATRAHYLRRLRDKGEMVGVFFAREPGQDKDRPEEWGPAIETIDWTGIDEAVAS